jgi:hypothetical protein
MSIVIEGDVEAEIALMISLSCRTQWVLHTSSAHYQKFAKYQRIYRRNIFCRYFEVEITDGHFPSVIQSVKTDENFSVRNSVGKYQRKFSVGIYRLNYGRKSFRI